MTAYYPGKLIIAAVIITVIALLLAIGVFFYSYRMYATYESLTSEVRLARANISHHEQMVSASANLAASTGDIRWVESYADRQKKLAIAVRKTVDKAPSSAVFQALADVDSTSRELLDIQQSAIMSVQQGNLGLAQAILADDAHSQSKSSYVMALDRLLNHVQLEAKRRTDNLNKQIKRLAALFFIFIATVLTIWYFVVRRLDRWRQLYIVQQRRKAEAEAEVYRLNEEFEMRVNQRVQELAHDDESLQRQVNFDNLTGLPNRRFGLQQFNAMLGEIQENNNSVALMIIDLVGFKRINEALGYVLGESLLKQAALRIRNAARREDTVVRLGGDEFMVFGKLANTDEVNKVNGLAERIIDAFDDPFVLGDDETDVSLTPNIGAALAPRHGDNVETLMQSADTAMPASQDLQRRSYQLFDSGMNDHALTRLQTESRLRHAVQRQELILHYQPQVDMSSGRVAGAEALLRWDHPQAGMMHAEQFVPIAQDTGDIIEIGDWVIEEVCRQLGVWRDKHGVDIGVSVNVAPEQLSQPAFKDLVNQALRRHRLDPKNLGIEVAQHTLLANDDTIQQMLKAINELGVMLLLDDFDSGYSALNYLKQHSFSHLKIDKSFVHGMLDSNNDTTLIQAIISMAESLNLTVIGEGVETPEQNELLLKYGCDYAQGYFYSRPLSAQEFVNFIDDVEADAVPVLMHRANA